METYSYQEFQNDAIERQKKARQQELARKNKRNRKSNK